MVYLKNQKAISSLLILIIVSATVIIAIGAVAIYLWLIPGESISEEMEYTDFTAVDVSSAFGVEITQSSSYSVLITADEKIFDNIEVTKTGNTLSIGIEPGIVISVSTLKAEITMPNLVELVLSGASKGTIEGFSSSESFVVELSGASRLEMQDINVGNTDIALSGASTLIAEGSGNDLISIVSGASSLDLTDFPIDNGDLSISGASQVTVNLDGTLDAIVGGASTLYYIGEPTIGDIDISGGSTINQK
jgi:hypothetical protein